MVIQNIFSSKLLFYRNAHYVHMFSCLLDFYFLYQTVEKAKFTKNV